MNLFAWIRYHSQSPTSRAIQAGAEQRAREWASYFSEDTTRDGDTGSPAARSRPQPGSVVKDRRGDTADAASSDSSRGIAADAEHMQPETQRFVRQSLEAWAAQDDPHIPSFDKRLGK